MAAVEEEPLEILPCGCVITTRLVGEQRLFVMIPCRVECKNLAYAVLEAKRQDKPVEFRKI